MILTFCIHNEGQLLLFPETCMQSNANIKAPDLFASAERTQNSGLHKAIIWKSPMPVNSYLMSRLTVYPMNISTIIFINGLYFTSTPPIECLTFFARLHIAIEDLFVVFYLLVIFTNVLILDLIKRAI